MTNKELYFYSNKSSKEHTMRVMLTPGVFVKSFAPFTVDPIVGSSTGKIYRIELFIGGSTCNIGTDSIKLSRGNCKGLVTLFFSKEDDHKRWLRNLEKATGSFNVKDFYSFTDIGENKKLEQLIN